MLHVRPPWERLRRSVLERAATAAPTYSEIGATGATDLPAGYTHDRSRADLGHDVFARAAEGLRGWCAHRGAGIDVYPPGAPVRTGTDVVLTIRVGALYVLAPCRVVHVWDDADRFGFAYGTLPGHPERGEEAFVVDRDKHGVAAFSIVAFSTPAAVTARIARPFARRIQQRTTRAYLDALRRYVADPR